jgi:hypothetical protein
VACRRVRQGRSDGGGAGVPYARLKSGWLKPGREQGTEGQNRRHQQ